MIVFEKGCFNELYYRALSLAVLHSEKLDQSRVGPVVNLGQAYFEIDGEDPRLIFLNERKLNPFFAIVEAAWVLQGSNQLEPLELAISNYHKYSDDGKTLNGAYGYRLTSYFGINQIEKAIDVLKTDPSSRRVVLSLYSTNDIINNSKDIPCNTTIYLKIREGHLDITVLNRSNDLYLGLPYNVFVFGVLQAYFARRLEVKRGKQRHLTDSLHLYECDLDNVKVVLSKNHMLGIQTVSSHFNWTYVESLLSHNNDILTGYFEKISDAALKEALSLMNNIKHGQKLSQFDDVQLGSSFVDFLVFQWKIGKINWGACNHQLLKLREKLMSVEMNADVSNIIGAPVSEIVKWIVKRAHQLEGHCVDLVSVLNSKSGFYSVRVDGKTEKELIYLILLSAILTKFDPYLTNTSIGESHHLKLKSVATELGVNSSDICPLNHVEQELFAKLNAIININA